ncbi:MAG: GNAT family N-acetyltransferase [Kiloniellales bacterium]
MSDQPGAGAPEDKEIGASLVVERLRDFAGSDLHDLCDAAEAAIHEGGGFGWLTPPPRNVMESFWRGVLLVPERELFAARLDGVIGGSAQLAHPLRNNEAQAMTGTLTTFFLAPWARGYGLGAMTIEAVIAAARAEGLKVLNLDLRETQAHAIRLYDQLGFVHWATHPNYAWVKGGWVSGRYYYKLLDQQDGSV